MKFEITVLDTNGVMSIHHLDHSPQKEEVEKLLLPLVPSPLPGRYMCSDWHFKLIGGMDQSGGAIRWKGKVAVVWSLAPTPMACDTRKINELAQDIEGKNDALVLGPVLIVTLNLKH
jgi:hypothetical protein